MIWKYALAALCGYLMGGVLFSYHLPKLCRRVDVTEVSEDGNPGATNAIRHAGLWVGMLCLAADILKGLIPVQLSMTFLDTGSIWFAMVMFAPVLGHATAPFYKGKGGKAIAVSFGVLIGLCTVSQALWVLAGVYIFFSTVWVIRPNERRTVISFGLLGLWAIWQWTKKRSGLALGCMLMSAAVMWKNRKMPKESSDAQMCAGESAA